MKAFTRWFSSLVMSAVARASKVILTYSAGCSSGCPVRGCRRVADSSLLSGGTSAQDRGGVVAMMSTNPTV